ncbi:MAG: protein kinase domain-containing protein [Myxococcaceae bacterium]
MSTPSPSDVVQVGAVLRETYALTDLLGRGGMGAVYIAKHLRLPGKFVAVKVIEGAGAGDEARRRFRREAEIAAHLNHPNIVEVLDYDMLPDGTPFLVLELLRGESLGARLEKFGKLKWEKVRAIVRQVGSGLRAAHRAGVIHRDLKPDNIFLIPTEADGGGSERVKLLDFGISKSNQSSTLKTQDAVLMGTPQYMSPEQAMGKNSEVDARSDVFALGCIVYEMLSGTAPFAGSSIPEVVYKVVHHEPQPLSALDPALAEVISTSVARAMAKAPDARFPDVASFIETLTGSPLQTLSEPVVITPQASSAPSSPDEPFEPTVRPTPVGAVAPAVVPLPAAAKPDVESPVLTRHERGKAEHPRGRTTEKVFPSARRWFVIGILLVGIAGLGVWVQRQMSPRTDALDDARRTPSDAPGAATVGGAGDEATEALAPPVPVPIPLPVPTPASVGPKRSVTTRAARDDSRSIAPPTTPPPTVAPTVQPGALPIPPSTTQALSRPPPVRPALPRLPSDSGARDDLAAAQAALKRADGLEALRLAQRSQRAELSQASFLVETQSYCLLGDLSNARAKWPSVNASEQAAVNRYCREHGLDLSEQ